MRYVNYLVNRTFVTDYQLPDLNVALVDTKNKEVCLCPDKHNGQLDRHQRQKIKCNRYKLNHIQKKEVFDTFSPSNTEN